MDADSAPEHLSREDAQAGARKICRVIATSDSEEAIFRFLRQSFGHEVSAARRLKKHKR
jgi:hypothetical protein